MPERARSPRRRQRPPGDSPAAPPPGPYTRREREVCLDPLLRLLLSRLRPGGTVIVGIQGGQGTGKTTLVGYLASRLAAEGRTVVSFSIDDFYAGWRERRRLTAAHPGNPFYRLPRGMPGTHRTGALREALRRLKAGRDVDLPVFDKAARRGEGDIGPRTVPVRGRRDCVLFEGWCVGIPESSPEDLTAAARRHRLPPVPGGFEAVLDRLRPYQGIWRMLDLLVMLRPESPDLHQKWRLQQERELVARRGAGLGAEEVREMVRLFLPFTALCYQRIKPDVRLCFDRRHRCRRNETVPPVGAGTAAGGI